jgi:hypothetical protein
VVPFREKGVPSVQQIEDKTSDFNRYYHQAGDTVDHMDHEYWHAMMRGLVATIVTWAGLVPEPATPTPTIRPTASPAPTATLPPSPTWPPAPTSSPTVAATPEPAQGAVLLPIAYSGRR